jgi:hypothetical protein
MPERRADAIAELEAAMRIDPNPETQVCMVGQAVPPALSPGRRASSGSTPRRCDNLAYGHAWID